MERLKNISVEEFTSPAPITVNTDTALNEILMLLKSNNIRHLPVLEDDIPVGIISEREVYLASQLTNIDELTAQDVMTPEPYSVSSGSQMDEVAYGMSSRKIGSAIVTDDKGHLTGIFTSTDALNALIEIIRGEV